MDDFYYTLGKWTFIGGGSALVLYLLIKLENYLADNKQYKKIDALKKRFEKKDPTLTIHDLDTLDDLYQWFFKKANAGKILRQGYREELESYERWILEERKIKEAKAAYHFCSGYIVNTEGRKVRAMCRMHKVTKAQTNLKILEDGYWVSDSNLKAEDMVVERQDLTFSDNIELEIK